MDFKKSNILLLAVSGLVILALAFLLFGNIRQMRKMEEKINDITILSDNLRTIEFKIYYTLFELQEHVYNTNEEKFSDFNENRINLSDTIAKVSALMNSNPISYYQGGREEINVLFAGIDDLSEAGRRLFILLERYREAVSNNAAAATLDQINKDILASFVVNDQIYDSLTINNKVEQIIKNQTAYRDLVREELDADMILVHYVYVALMFVCLFLFIILAVRLKRTQYSGQNSGQNKSITKAKM